MPTATRLRLLTAAALLATALAAACGSGSPPGGPADIPVVRPTPSACQNASYPAEAPQLDAVGMDQFAETPTGLRVYDMVTGDGEPASGAARVRVNYTGWLEGGCVFDTTYSDQQPAEFAPANLIQGWEEGILEMRVGGQRRMVIPPQLGYGPLGFAPVIPPDSTLIFHVELLDVIDAPEATATAEAQATAAADARATAEARATATAEAAPQTPQPTAEATQEPPVSGTPEVFIPEVPTPVPGISEDPSEPGY